MPDVPPLSEPLLFKPHYVEKIWGGRRLEHYYNRQLPPGKSIGESWELSAVESAETVVASGCFSGKPLSSVFSDQPVALAGETAARFSSFPLLVKFIDANDRLSIQVHPNDLTARSNYGEPFGKTECWYIADAGKNGTLGIGLKKEISRSDLRKTIENGEIEQLLNTVQVKTGEVYFIPSGTIHAILDDLLIYEVQQNSNTTFRLYDWNRTDTSGKQRPLHIEDGISCANLSYRDTFLIDPREIPGDGYKRYLRAACSYFALEEYVGDHAAPIPLPPCSSLRVITLLDGTADLQWNSGSILLTPGMTSLIPAKIPPCTINGHERFRFITVTIPDLEGEVIKPLKAAGYTENQIAGLGDLLL